MVETKTKKIDGKEVMVTQFPAFEGLRIKSKLMKTIGPAVAALLGEVKNSFNPKDAEFNISGCIELLVEKLDENETPELIERLLTSTRINGREVTRDVFNMEFAGNYQTLYNIIAFVLQVNHFFDFLLTGNIKGALTGVGNPSTTSSSDTLTKA